MDRGTWMLFYSYSLTPLRITRSVQRNREQRDRDERDAAVSNRINYSTVARLIKGNLYKTFGVYMFARGFQMFFFTIFEPSSSPRIFSVCARIKYSCHCCCCCCGLQSIIFQILLYTVTYCCQTIVVVCCIRVFFHSKNVINRITKMCTPSA